MQEGLGIERERGQCAVNRLWVPGTEGSVVQCMAGLEPLRMEVVLANQNLNMKVPNWTDLDKHMMHMMDSGLREGWLISACRACSRVRIWLIMHKQTHLRASRSSLPVVRVNSGSLTGNSHAQQSVPLSLYEAHHTPYTQFQLCT